MSLDSGLDVGDAGRSSGFCTGFLLSSSSSTPFEGTLPKAVFWDMTGPKKHLHALWPGQLDGPANFPMCRPSFRHKKALG